MGYKKARLMTTNHGNQLLNRSTTDLRYSAKYARKKNEDHALQSYLDNEDDDERKEPAAAVEDSEPVNDREKEEVSVE